MPLLPSVTGEPLKEIDHVAVSLSVMSMESLSDIPRTASPLLIPVSVMLTASVPSTSESFRTTIGMFVDVEPLGIVTVPVFVPES